MSPVDARALLFGSEAERDWQMVEANLQKAQSVDPAKAGPESAWVALAIDHAYEAFETMLVRFERSLGLPQRSGAAWHRAILDEASRAIPGLRPALVPVDVLPDWADLLAFRHFLRHAYSADLEAPRLATLTARLARAVAVTAPAVRSFVEVLRRDVS